MEESNVQEDRIMLAYKPSERTYVSPLFLALAERDYDQVRHLTGHTDQDKFELLLKVGQDAGDSEYRTRHQVDRSEAVLIWNICIDELNKHCELDRSEMLMKLQFD